jgi:hypothetical protein
MMVIDPAVIEQLQQHAKVHRLDEIALDAIRKWIDDDDSELKSIAEEIEARFSSRWLCFEPEIVDYPYIDSRFDLYHQGKRIGYYRLISMLDGRIEDDYFVVEDEYDPPLIG